MQNLVFSRRGSYGIYYESKNEHFGHPFTDPRHISQQATVGYFGLKDRIIMAHDIKLLKTGGWRSSFDCTYILFLVNSQV